MDYDSLLELVIRRRSIRKFKREPVPDEYVDKIIDVARWAPSGSNSQPWQFIVIKKQDQKNKIVELVNEHSKLMHRMEVAREPELRFIGPLTGWSQAPVFILLCGDFRTSEAYPLYITLQLGRETFISSLASAFLYMTLAVTALGLGGQWVSAIGAPFVQSLTKDLLGIPKELEIYDMLAIGYPDTEPKSRLVRAREEVVHYDYYDKDKYPTEHNIKEYIASLIEAKRHST